VKQVHKNLLPEIKYWHVPTFVVSGDMNPFLRAATIPTLQT
jgi:hypothetical protein